MPVDFQQIHEQVKKFGESALRRAEELQVLRQTAQHIMQTNTDQVRELQEKVAYMTAEVDPTLRCAVPFEEPLTSHFPLPPEPTKATVIAVDGSQIPPDRHAQVNYCLVNVGAIQMTIGSEQMPATSVFTDLYYDKKFYRNNGIISDTQLALERDLFERKQLAELVIGAEPPIVTLTDGPLELWGGQDRESSGSYRDALKAYTEALKQLQLLDVITGGYVDKPAANLVVRLLEVAMTPGDELKRLQHKSPLQGVMDRDLFSRLLAPGERSAVFAIQFKSANFYAGDLALHFFYLNAGRADHPWIARVEIPKWVAKSGEQTDLLHAILVEQSRILGNRPYPYLLHRAHEVAVVTRQEKEQITQLLARELMNRHIPVGEISHKQAIKNLEGRTRYER